MKNAGGLVALALLSLAPAAVARADEKPAAPDWARVGDILGKAGDLAPDGSYKVTVLRTDPPVRGPGGMPIPAGLGLNSYAAFVGTIERATVVGDTCMLAHEVGPVIDALRAGGLEVVALHNHMLAEEPRLFFLHFQGRGEALALARTVRAAWDELGKARPPEPEPPAAAPGAEEPDWGAVALVLGRKGSRGDDGVFKATLPRADLDVSLDGQRLAPGVGLACWAAFFACPCGRTKVMGDTCVTREELQPAIDALRRGGCEITALHNHLLGERGDVMFLHFEGEGDPVALARAVRAAWDALGK